MEITTLLCFFDVETTGLCYDCELVSFALKVNGEEPNVVIRDREMSEKELLQRLGEMVADLKMRDRDTRFVTHFGESRYEGGFDFPFLRMRYMQHRMAWPFCNTKHFDTYPIIKKRLNTKAKIPVSLSNFGDCDANALNLIATKCNCKPANKAKPTKDDNYKAILEYAKDHTVDFDSMDLQPFEKDVNKLDFVYEILGGPDLGVDVKDMNGAKFPAKWAEYQMKGSEKLRALLAEYNASDVWQLEYVYNYIMDYFPNVDRTSFMDL